MSKKHYGHLALMTSLSFVSMYVLMYAMVDRFANVYLNLNQFYMAGLMAAPMVLIELAVMRAMFQDRTLNALFVSASLVALILFFVLIRQQSAISDRQFLRSMIPHHAGAILMCEKSNLQDPELKSLCRSIVSGQQSEIDLMTAKLKQLEQ